MHYFLGAVLFLSLVSANAQVFRCTSPGGKVEYSDAPCAPGSKDAHQVAPKATVDPAALQQENQRLRMQVLEEENRRLKSEVAAARNAAAAPAPAGPVVGRTAADIQADRADSFACRQAKRDYEFALSSIGGRSTVPAAKAAMYSACGLQPPSETTVEVRDRRSSTCVRVGGIFQCH
ncbi:DUF4124 domain-containing protein [Ramlibacter sp. G-1-2-2]|uniref:DUF4124 domain-containing protein n=1 Tax=Ramlibacter agri TaxID=2728837 RepID=A0A848HJ35_9BURK|nr:DUF4124 domain-containing protein [Ramlibacter agri]NML47748.1 DUF4124 domain-containing protein [Ramlibacter agri]